ncbi:MAG: 50S ribosomal protein L25 [Acidobacteriota bacterium]|nr:50S ribosomal protein L25 [Acidobacteriota bacterium]
MADKVIIKAEKREGRGKNDTRRLRAAGKVPLSIYGGGGEAVAATAELKDLAAVLRSDSGSNTIFTIDMVGEGTNDVIFHDRQIDALKGRLVHADLRRLAKGEKIEVTIPIHITGEPVGLKEEGAVLNQALREIKVLCEPRLIPEFFEVDVTDLNVGDSYHVSDLKLEKGVEILDDAETVVASIVIVKEEELEPQTDEAGEPEIVGGEEAAGESKPGSDQS